MVYIPGNIPPKEEVLKAVREAMAKCGGRITRAKFLAESGMKGCDVLRYHSGWNALLREAGCTRDARNGKVDPARLLADWGGVVRKLKRVPSWNEYPSGKRGRSSLFTLFHRPCLGSCLMQLLSGFVSKQGYAGTRRGDS